VTRPTARDLVVVAAVIELGSVDAAAERLHVTQSAVSQRIKALEQRVGQVLVVREKPCTATAAGVPPLRLACSAIACQTVVIRASGGDDATFITAQTIFIDGGAGSFRRPTSLN
jgi:LysR family transcriptional regulator, chromosome initiation inhibitor